MKNTEQQIISEIIALTSCPIDRLDIGITLNQAMTEENRQDLLAMINFLKSCAPYNPEEILKDIMHDIYGFKNIYLNLESKDSGWIPRSNDYFKKTIIIPAK